jgi:hypothetical protein
VPGTNEITEPKIDRGEEWADIPDDYNRALDQASGREDPERGMDR